MQRKELDGVQATIQAKFVPLSVMKEKESLLTQLREDMAMLQKLTKSEAASSEHSRREYIVKIATLERESKDREEKMDNIKAVAVKAKKELDKSRKDVVALTEEVGVLKTERDCQDTGVGKRTRVAGLVTHDLPSGLLRTQMQRVKSAKTRTQEVDPKAQKNSKR